MKKTLLKILARYLASAVGITLTLLVLNLAVLIALLAVSSNAKSSDYNFPEIAASLTKEDGRYQLSESGRQIIQKQYQWAMLLDDSGAVVWSLNLPQEIPLKYTVAEVASFTRWYLQDYPVYVWRHPDGLLVLGSAKGSLWKHGMEAPEVVMANLPAWMAGALMLNAVASVLLALLSGLRLFRSLKTLAGGIEDMAMKKPVELSTSGILGDLAGRLNQASARLQQQEAALQKRDNARTTWIAGVSHDIRTPLSMVMGYASELEESPHLPQAEREQAGIVRRQSEKIKTLVSDLNLASKLEYDMQPLRTERIYPAELARGVVTDFLNSGLEPAYSIELQADKEVQKVTVEGDEELLRRAISNLIQNSIRHNPDGCAITVTVAASFTHCSITVADNGAGYPQEVVEAFKGPETPAVLQSHGLGLIIVRQIARAHGGRVDFRNRAQSGCAAEMQLPLGE
jgi:signal transduction histidine kinase